MNSSRRLRDSFMAWNAESDSVADIVSRIRVCGPRLNMMSVQATPTRAALLAGVVVSLVNCGSPLSIIVALNQHLALVASPLVSWMRRPALEVWRGSPLRGLGSFQNALFDTRSGCRTIPRRFSRCASLLGCTSICGQNHSAPGLSCLLAFAEGIAEILLPMRRLVGALARAVFALLPNLPRRCNRGRFQVEHLATDGALHANATAGDAVLTRSRAMNPTSVFQPGWVNVK